MEQQNHLISIVLPVYNGEKFLGQAIESCLGQTFSNLELIIVDDCSTDSTGEIIENFAQKDERVKVVKNSRNRNLPASLNIGHAAAQGKFFTWTSHDNFYEPKALEILMTELQKSTGDIVYSNFNLIDGKGQVRRRFALNENISLLFGNSIGACFLYKREVFERNGGYDEKLHTVEDYDFWLAASKHSRFHYVPKTLYSFRSHQDSLSADVSHKGSIANKHFRKRLKISYSKFFTSFEELDEKPYANLFCRFHQHKEIDVASFMKSYGQFKKDMEFLSKRVQILDLQRIQYETDIRIRGNITPFQDNRNIETLWSILFNRPILLLKHDRRRGLNLILKCLKF